ncbi:hypothetical protein TURU_167674 [Turdus rufiventris]|nr:hypothetical protein TURU_167674 [Turdus rufiventris]
MAVTSMAKSSHGQAAKVFQEINEEQDQRVIAVKVGLSVRASLDKTAETTQDTRLSLFMAANFVGVEGWRKEMERAVSDS